MTRSVVAAVLLGTMLTLTLAFQSRPDVHPVVRSTMINPSSLSNHHLAQGRRRFFSPLNVMTDWEPDISEMVGGIRYEMVPLPDRMCDTTVFVGNICEFVCDQDLSQLFQTVSSVQSVPACVIRKPNMQSLYYGFVSFLTVEEKEAAILRFHGTEWRGKRIKVERIQDNPKWGRVRVPESMVTYVSGALKKTRNGKVNSMRRARDGEASNALKAKKKKRKAHFKKAQALKKQKRGGRIVGFQLSQSEQQEVFRACKKGYLTLDGRRAGHGSLANLCSSESLKGSKMAMAHRDWCDERAKPNIILYKASGRHSREVLDHIIVDLSPLRDQMSSRWTTEILNAAATAAMDLRRTEDADDCVIEPDQNDADAVGLDLTYSESLARQPISKLPFVSMGFFVGERSKAKAMAKALSQLWELPAVEEMNEADEDEAHVPHGEGGRYQNTHGRRGKHGLSKGQDRRRAQRRRTRSDDFEQSMGRYSRY